MNDYENTIEKLLPLALHLSLDLYTQIKHFTDIFEDSHVIITSTII